MISALNQSKIRPLKMHDWGSESGIDPINTLVYIQARHLASRIAEWYETYNSLYGIRVNKCTCLSIILGCIGMSVVRERGSQNEAR
jgi:hypothetical protein